MLVEKEKNIIDLTFIGSGISSSFSIIKFLEKIDEIESNNSCISIRIIEKYPELGPGIPYGERSGYSVHLITSLEDFLPKIEREKFVLWLNENKKGILEKYKNEGGELAKGWLATNFDKIEHNDWDDLFIPRRFFGDYLSETLKKTISKLEEKGRISFDHIIGEVTDLNKNEDGYTIYLNDDKILHSKKVILCLGSLPSKNIYSNEDFVESDTLLFVNKPYQPTLNLALDRIKDFTERINNKKVNVLIIGSNASGLELLYKLNDYSKIKEKINSFSFISTLGLIPDALGPNEKPKKFIPLHLNELKDENNLTAKVIADATYKDLELAEKNDVGAASCVHIISSAFGELLERLNTSELKEFSCFYGNDIGRKQRLAGLHYLRVIEKLKSRQKFNHIAGRFIDLKTNSEGDYELNYKDSVSNESKTFEEPFNIVINCIGSTNLTQNDIPVLLKNIIEKGYCIPNDSKIGFDVNSSLEVTKDLHIVGPLLAGNVIENKAVWHVEHCGRIIWLSEILSRKLADQIINSTSIKTDNEYQLIVKSLENKPNIKEYKSLLKDSWNNNIYYSFEHLKNFEKNENSVLKYFLLKKNDEPIIIMPFIFRKILGTEYFDTITQYGYGGPLYNGKENSEDLKIFWKNVDEWYSKNNVVSEFVRFSLNGNHKNYSGNLIQTLTNVKGTISDSFETYWNSFNGKVRNNYRKALKNDLTFAYYRKSEITELHLKSFYNIYINTMKRKNAKSLYFFSWHYVKKLVLNNLDNFSIAFAYKDNIAISTELIINYKDSIFAFLGGTDAFYFSVRPNDFLRVEILKWAIENDKKEYILGGGMKDNDSLYKSKKYYFPKHKDVIFYTGRKIINPVIYDELCTSFSEKYTRFKEEDSLNEQFFPFYRCLINCV